MNSNRSMEIIGDIWAATSIELPVNVFFEAPTIRRMAAAIHDGSALVAPELVRLRSGDEGAPLFLFPGGAGNLIELTDLVEALDFPGAVYGIAFSGLDGAPPFHDRFEQEAARSFSIIRRVQPAGPVRLVGYSIGGAALETARGWGSSRRGPGRISRSDRYPAERPFLALRRVARLLGAQIRRQDSRTAPAALRAAAAVWLRGSVVRRAAIHRPGPTSTPRRGSQFTFRFRDPNDPNYPYSPYWRSHGPPNVSRVARTPVG